MMAKTPTIAFLLVLSLPAAVAHDPSLIPTGNHGLTDSAGFWNIVDGFSTKSGYRQVFTWDVDEPIAAQVEWGYSPTQLDRIANPLADAADTAGLAIADVPPSEVVPGRTVYFRVIDLAGAEPSPVKSYSIGNAWRADSSDGIYEINALMQLDSEAGPDVSPGDLGLRDMARGIDIMAERVWDYTDGYVRIGKVLVTDTVLDYPANQWFGPGVCLGSQDVAGYNVQHTLADFLVETVVPLDSHTWGQEPPAIDDPCTAFYIGRVGWLCCPWVDDLDLGATMAHEFGHYAFGFEDLYQTPTGGTADCWAGVTGPPDNAAGQWDITVMYNDIGYRNGRWYGTELDRGPSYTPCNYGDANPSWPILVDHYPGIPAAGRLGNHLPNHADSSYTTPRGNPDGGALQVYVLDHEPGVSRTEHFIKAMPAPPVADGGGPYSGQVNQPIAFAGTVSGGTAPFTYAWAFGDGGTAATAVASHTYASAGTFTATFTVTDADSRVSQSVRSVQVSPPASQPPQVSGVYVAGVESTRATVGWTVQGTSPIETRVHYGIQSEMPYSSGIYNGPGSWEFALTGLTPGTQYYYQVRSANPSTGATAQSPVGQFSTPNPPQPPPSQSPSPTPSSTPPGGGSAPSNGSPTAYFTLALSNMSLRVDASSSYDPEGDPLSYAWSFGDGGSAAGVQAQHAYAAPGRYKIELTARDGFGGQGRYSRSIDIVAAAGPKAQLSATATDVVVGQSVQFDAKASRAGDAPIRSYDWDLDDGRGFRTGAAIITHSFRAPGAYEVRVRVIDAQGRTDVASIAVTVAASGEGASEEGQPKGSANLEGPEEAAAGGALPGPPLWVALAGLFVVCLRRGRLKEARGRSQKQEMLK